MVLDIRLEQKRVDWGRYNTTIICHVSDAPPCKRCNKPLDNNNYARLCDNNVFYCEKCWTEDFSHEHYHTFNDKNEHNDRLVFIIVGK